MNDWVTAFSSSVHSGVYSVDENRDSRVMKKAALGSGLDYTNIDLKNVIDKGSFLMTAARALRFPAYFGMNWDAFYECLTDLSWKPATGYVIVFTNYRTVSDLMTAEGQIVSSIFEAAARQWQQKKVPFYIILSV